MSATGDMKIKHMREDIEDDLSGFEEFIISVFRAIIVIALSGISVGLIRLIRHLNQ